MFKNKEEVVINLSARDYPANTRYAWNGTKGEAIGYNVLSNIYTIKVTKPKSMYQIEGEEILLPTKDLRQSTNHV